MGNSLPPSSSDSSLEDTVPLPSKYVILKHLGEGGYGRVVKCLDLKTAQTVAIKTAKHNHNLSNEASIMKVLMDHNLDQRNIIKFYDGFSTDKYLVFEVLDINLMEYISRRKTPMPLQHIREVIQQLATALDALKNVGVIHTDLKANNIMLVDRARHPLKVKLIDFGLAVFKFDAKNTKIHQTPFFRAPEVMLGLPFSEAVDIWSLGCVMTIMVFGFSLFPGRADYDILRYIIDIMGPPPDHLIDAGQRSWLYFTKTDSNQWILKTPAEYWGSTYYFIDNRRYTFRSLDEAKTMCLEKNNMAEADERRECIELLKLMLKWDERERITPSEILAHPFITMSYLSSSSHLRSCDEALESASAEFSPSQAAEPGTEQTPETSTDKAAEPSTSTCGTQGLTSGFVRVRPAAVMVTRPSGVVVVQTAPPQNRILLEEKPDEESISETLIGLHIIL